MGGLGGSSQVLAREEPEKTERGGPEGPWGDNWGGPGARGDVGSNALDGDVCFDPPLQLGHLYVCVHVCAGVCMSVRARVCACIHVSV